MSESRAPAAPIASGSEVTVRGRGGFKGSQLVTIPEGLSPEATRAQPNAPGQALNILTNYIKVRPMKDRQIWAYRVDFEPNVEAVSLRHALLKKATANDFGPDVLFDGMNDARSGKKLEDVEKVYNVNHPKEPKTAYQVTLKRVGPVPYGPEVIRIYNMNMRDCLKALKFFQVSKTGAFVHPALATKIGQSDTIVAVRGFKTATNVSDNDEILLQLEACHKLMQRINVRQYMTQIESHTRGDMRANFRSMLVGKLLITSYNKIMYKIEDINFDLSPKSSFPDRATGQLITYNQYFKQKYDVTVVDQDQPLLLVVQNNKRNRPEQQGNEKDIYVIPELCNIAGLTDQQRNDTRLKTDLIRSSQIDPRERVEHMKTFMNQLHNNQEVTRILKQWGYGYEDKPVEVKGRLLPMEAVGLGKMAGDPKSWPKADTQTGSFEQKVMREHVAKVPELSKLAIIMPNINPQHRQIVLNRLKEGFQKCGLDIKAAPRVFDLNNDNAHMYVQTLKSLPEDVTMTICVLQYQNKDRYDAIKKLASVERGLVTQVVTAKLLLDERKASGASTKIGIQVAAKIGGEPWYIDIPLAGDMICGYDTYHDTANRGRSYGAFIASMNPKFSRWFSKADAHDMLDELSSHLAHNLTSSLTRFRDLNEGRAPKRIFIYRDGVGDGQVEHVYNTELKHIRKSLDEFSPGIRLTFIIVNKTVGARFYMQNHGSFLNPTPGSVIDNTITRKGRFDFYLISQSTRNGTVAPTYYNIIHDESSLDAAKHQMLAFKLCFLYYNWTGTVRVPAPCQYAHKLALLCGEHLHAIPNAKLDDRLHFL